MSGQAGSVAQEQQQHTSWQDELEFRQRPPTSSTSDYSEHSFHIRSKSSANVLNSPKRLSVFGSRTRSNTTTSSTRSPASSSSGEAPAPPPHDEKHMQSDSVARSLLLRGSRILRRQGSKLNVASTVDEEDDGGRGSSKFEVGHIFQRPQRMKRTDSHEQLKRIISEPYNFQHVTHTSSSQYHALDTADNYELVDEFSAMQASQTPEPGLRGIHAEDLHSTNTSAENLHNDAMDRGRSQAVSPSAMSPPTSPVSPARVENFSRPVSRLNKPLPPAPAMVPPPRSSSRQAYVEIPEPTSQAMDEYLGLNSQLAMPDYHYVRSEEVELPRMSGPEDMGYQASTLSNNEDVHQSATLVNSYLSDLEDVPEEADQEPEPQENPEPEDDSHVEPLSPQAVSPKTGESNPQPAALTLAKTALAHRDSVVVVQDPQLSFSEDLMSPTLPQFRPDAHTSPVSQASDAQTAHREGGYEEFSTSWDEDIDFIYEHAAEANCDFDWNRVSLDLSQPWAGPDASPGTDRGLTVVNNSLSVSSIPNTPDLDPGSAQSILTRSHEAITPLSEGAAPVGFFPAKVPDKEYLKLQTSDIGDESGYEEFLAVQDDTDGQVHYYPPGRSHSVDAPVSPRSSYSPISKCNSQESVMLSRAASIVRKHRSSTSTTSVPDLVPSANSNATRESIESSDNGTSAPLAEAPRPPFSYHRQVKSLAPEINLFANVAAARGNGSIDVIADMPYPLVSPVSPLHDRTKSASAADHHKNTKIHQRADGAPATTRPMSLAQKRKSRAGYSLFPTGVTATSPR